MGEFTPDEKIVYLLKPRGFCAGVVRAIDIVELALKVYGPPIYVRREIVHNRHVVEDLASRGAIFVEELDEVPTNARVVYSAHGVAPSVREDAERRNLQVIDATCPLVTKVHLEAVRFAASEGTILLIGHRDHEEVVGTKGEAPRHTIVVSTSGEAESVDVPDLRQRLLPDTDHAEPRRSRTGHLRAEEALPTDPRSAGTRYLLRHREPSASREARCAGL